MTARVHRSEPDQALLRRPRSAWQRERERGVIQPMDAPYAKVGRWELIGTLAIVLIVATIFFGKALS